ncbi:MAG: histidine ammonia-lyase, partial [Actinomycetota bacterium]|nr:histidine ammonia-lyase [Actinomycetota bacterium]
EALSAAQGLDLRAPLSPSQATAHVVEHLRARSPFLEEDRPLSEEIAAIKTLVAAGHLAGAAEEMTGPLA